MIEKFFDAAVIVGILASGIRLATPYLYAAIGETFSQRSGVLNLGVEGQMLLGAFFCLLCYLYHRQPVLRLAGCYHHRPDYGAGDGICEYQS